MQFAKIHNPKTIICEAQAIKAEKLLNSRKWRTKKAVQAKKSVR